VKRSAATGRFQQGTTAPSCESPPTPRFAHVNLFEMHVCSSVAMDAASPRLAELPR
jgi:hypothetical protein